MRYPELDIWQYRIARDLPQGMSIGQGWLLETGEDLDKVVVLDASGTRVGLLLGFPIDLKARRLIANEWQSAHKLAEDPDTFVENVMMELGGRFLWMFMTETIHRIYTDISAQISCVYDADAKTVGSTAYALLDSVAYDHRFNQELYDDLRVDGEGWFPCELTAHHGLKRLLPNAYLDLTTFQTTRYWPLGSEPPAESPENLVAPFIEVIQAQLEALVNGPQKVAMALTAGLDSRTILACARPYQDKISCFTVTGSDRHALDSVMAKRITAQMGIDHITLPRQSASPEQRALFLRRGGHCNGDSNSTYHPTVWPLQKDYVFVGGAGGEVSRPPLFRHSDTPDTSLSADQILSRLGFKKNDQTSRMMTEKLSEMNTSDITQILDIVHLEDRYGAWYAVQFCSDPTLVRHAPFLTLQTVRMMMQLPADWKLSYRFEKEVIQQAWPELAEFPYNSLGPWRDRWIKVQRVLNDPSIVAKKIRKLRG